VCRERGGSYVEKKKRDKNKGGRISRSLTENAHLYALAGKGGHRHIIEGGRKGCQVQRGGETYKDA